MIVAGSSGRKETQVIDRAKQYLGPILAAGLVAALAMPLIAEHLQAQQTRVPGKAGPAPAEAQPAADVPRRVVVRFVTDSDYPPFNYFDEDGVLIGFNVDLARALCLELSAACDIKTRPWDELLPAVRRGEADAAIAGHAITPKALAVVDFTDRYFHTPGRFATRRNAEKVDITPEALEGKKIAVARGTSHEAFLRSYFRESVIQTFDSVDLARDALLSSKADLVFDDGVSLLFWANGSASRDCCELRGGPFLEPRFFGDGVAIAVPKTDPQIRNLLNQALKRVRESGRYEELMLRYFPSRVF